MKRLVEAINHLDGARVLLTGGTGFVGKWLIETAHLACSNGATNFEIIVPTRDPLAPHVLETREIGFKDLSLIEGHLLTDNLNIGKVDAIIHAATPASAKLNESNPAEMTRINTQSMQSALKFAKHRIPFLFTSSGAVYGNQPQSVTHISEMQDQPYGELTSAYAKGKQLAELMCMQAGEAGACAPIVARLFAFSGHHLPRDTHFAIGNFVQNVLDHKPILISGDGSPRRSYLYGADMAIWLWSALAKKNSLYPLHIGSEHSVSILELAQAVARVSAIELNFVPEIKVANTSANPKKFHQYVPANSITKSQLDVQEWTTLETGISLMMRDTLR
ncbi:MAG: NAD(P)-dependent oxidoreductase [Actinomycetota bacterium]|nr:NAD(P)-dependent oxidoreductase [Actinomycetota bacterium]